ncbi:MAG: hypothetical protein SPI87_07085 [Anaerobutyricum sp.]|nr:hypothetical protein [Eubacterium sp.]MDY6046767.1 hypothetical protein [Anaerobutyricum sp.]
MLTLIFLVMMILVFGKILGFAIRAAWGVSKIVCTVVFLPLLLVGLVLIGLVKIALPILLIVGGVSLLLPKING